MTDWLTHSTVFHTLDATAPYAMVSRTWRAAVKDWRKEITHLDHENCSVINDAVLHIVARSCPKLETLNLSRIHTWRNNVQIMSDPDQALSAVARGCPRLRNINLAAGFKLGTAENMDCTVLPLSLIHI